MSSKFNPYHENTNDDVANISNLHEDSRASMDKVSVRKINNNKKILKNSSIKDVFGGR